MQQLSNMMFVLTALFFNTMTAPLVKLTQNDEGGYDYNKWCVYFFSELLKLAVALTSCWGYKVELRDFAQYAIPALVFFVQNNLSFLALQHMDASAFQLLMNTRIITVAFLSVLVLKKRLNSIEWMSILLLMVGAMQYQLGCSSMRVDFEGLLVTSIIVFCAAGGNVYTQKIMQNDQPLMLQNAYLYVWGVLFNGLNWSLSIHRGEPAFGSFHFVQFFSILFYAVYGLSISIILKRFGAITRTFINTAAICCTAFVDVFFFGSHISIFEMTTFVVILMAVFAHTVIAKSYVHRDTLDITTKV